MILLEGLTFIGADNISGVLTHKHPSEPLLTQCGESLTLFMNTGKRAVTGRKAQNESLHCFPKEI